MTLWSLLDSVSKRCRFELDLTNKSFLDETWDRPEVRRIELVPCKDLGLMICPVRLKFNCKNFFVTSVVPNLLEVSMQPLYSGMPKSGLRLWLDKYSSDPKLSDFRCLSEICTELDVP